jgi:O-antigen/teichoic acid export membrane protein
MGATYNMAVSAATLVLGFVRSVLLIRLLTPEEFGNFALALFFMVFLAPFSTLGIDLALLQSMSPKKEAFSTHFVLRLVLAAVVLALGILVSPLLRRVYVDQVIVVDILLLLLAIHVLSAASSTPGVVARRQLLFRWIAVSNLSASLAMTITAPLLAFLGAGVWSLVAEQAVGPIVKGVGLWAFVRPWRPSLRFDRREAKYLLGFGRHVFSSHMLGILLDRFDDFWVGTALGPIALGYYSRAYEIARYPKRVLATPVTNVFLTTYSTIQHDAEGLTKAFLGSSSVLVRAGLLVAVVLIAVIPEITVLLFGEIWSPIVPIFRFMAVYVTLDPLYVNLCYLFIGAGYPERVARVRLLQVALFVVAVVVSTSRWGVIGVAIAADLMMLFGTVALLGSSRALVTLPLWRMAGWPLIAGLAAVVTGFGLTQVTQAMSPWYALFLKAGGVCAAYGLVLYLAERDDFRQYGAEILRPLWSRVRSRISPGSACGRKAL